MSILLIAGLGNPGLGYAKTRHNVGWMLIDACAKHRASPWVYTSKHRAWVAHLQTTPSESHKVHLLKPATWMNLNGECIASYCHYYRISSAEELLVIHDDITLPVGRSKLSVKGSSGGHNGVENVYQQTGAVCPRYRVGIGCKARPEMDLKDHVLATWSSEEKHIMANCLPLFCDDILMILRLGVTLSMNTINARKNTHDTNPSTQ